MFHRQTFLLLIKCKICNVEVSDDDPFECSNTQKRADKSAAAQTPQKNTSGVCDTQKRGKNEARAWSPVRSGLTFYGFTTRGAYAKKAVVIES